MSPSYGSRRIREPARPDDRDGDRGAADPLPRPGIDDLAEDRLKDRGLEPDECYYLAHVAPGAAARRSIDLSVDPPPDLADRGRDQPQRPGPHGHLRRARACPRSGGSTARRCRVEQLQADGTYATVADQPEPADARRLDEVVRWVRRGARRCDDHSGLGPPASAEWVREPSAGAVPALDEPIRSRRSGMRL